VGSQHEGQREAGYARLAGADGCRELLDAVRAIREAFECCDGWLARHPAGCRCDWCAGLAGMHEADPDGGPDPAEHRDLLARACRDLRGHARALGELYLPGHGGSG
jgi:hypothetical protein